MAFEVHDPEGVVASLDPGHTYRSIDLPDVGVIETWTELAKVAMPLVTFHQHFVFRCEGTTMVSAWFRSEPDVARSLAETGFQVDEIRDDPDRPGLELVFIASRKH